MALVSLAHGAFAEEVRLHQIQMVGTHNSYHLAPHSSLQKVLQTTSTKLAKSLQYSHRPLDYQLSKLGVRQIELDLFADPVGGHYAEPNGPSWAKDLGLPFPTQNDSASLMRQPGLKVLHVPDIDYGTTVQTFRGALELLRQWSQANPRHLPIMVLIELKQSQASPLLTKPVPFDADMLDTVDREILEVISRDRIITPKLVRGDAETLRDAILHRGWPRLSEVRGKLLFALDNGPPLRDAYLKGHEGLQGRLLFVNVPEVHPAAAFMKINDPIGSFEKIKAAVKKGFLVRTRADADTVEARENDSTRFQKALASGAQYISTDYPEPNPEFSNYAARLPGKVIARINPLFIEIDGAESFEGE